MAAVSAWRALGLAVLLLGALCGAVDRANFKKCSDSSFCKRNRDNADQKYTVVGDTVNVGPSTVTMDLLSGDGNTRLTMALSALKSRTVHVLITEKAPLHPRYRVEGVVPEQLEYDTWAIKEKSNERLTAVFGVSNTVVVTFTPLRIDVFSGDDLVASVNSRGLLHVEAYRAKGEGEAEGAWEETWKTHADSKPRGPSAVSIDVTFPGAQHVYGIPEHASALSLPPTRGTGTDSDPYRLFNLDVFEYELDNPMALYGSIPFMLAHRARQTTGFLLLNAAEMWVDVARTASSAGLLRRLQGLFATDEAVPSTETHWIAESGMLDMYLTLGPAPRDVFQQYARLTGLPAMPPLWALAYHQCRWNYNDEADVATVSAKFDEHDTPVDVVWLDIEHTDSKKYMTWDAVKFPHPEEMQRGLARVGRKMVTIVDPHIKTASGYMVHEEATRLDYYVKNKDGATYEGWCWPGSSSWLDFFNPEVRAWWAGLFAYDKYGGSTPSLFTWNDMNEPSVFNGPEVTIHKDAKHYGGWENRDVHNAYGMWQHASTFQGQLQRSGGQERPFVLSRAFFVGTQRYGAIWTGDNKADWSHLRASLPMLLSLGVAGLPFVGADIGGFFGNPDVELLIRWYQAGSFQPFMRAHAHLDTRRREPYLFPAESFAPMRAAIRGRYTWLHYWYTQFHVAATSGVPVMRPLWIEYPDDAATFGEDAQYLIGSDLLVAPVTVAGATQQTVYFPGSEPWYGVDGGAVHRAPSREAVAVTLASIPVYQRGGSIIPRKLRIRRSSALGHADPFTLEVALDRNASARGLLYADDYHSVVGAGLANAALMQFDFAATSATSYALTSVRLAGAGASQEAVERIVIRGLPRAPRRAVAGGVDLAVAVDAATGDVRIKKPGFLALENARVELFL